MEENLNIYLNEISKIPILSRKKEFQVANLIIKKDDSFAKEKLFVSNLKFVVKISKQYLGCGLLFSDLIGEGNLGLFRAIEKYSPNKGVRFISYATYWIKQSIIKAIAEKSKVVKIPLNINNTMVKIEKEIKNNDYYKWDDDLIKKLAEKTNVKSKVINTIIPYMYKKISLDGNIMERDGEEIRLIHKIKDHSQRLPEDIATENIFKRQIYQAISILKTEEKDIIKRRFGLDGKKPRTLSELGLDKGVTKERVRQIEKKALLKLKNFDTVRAMKNIIS